MLVASVGGDGGIHVGAEQFGALHRFVECSDHSVGVRRVRGGGLASLDGSNVAFVEERNEAVGVGAGTLHGVEKGTGLERLVQVAH